MSSEGRPSHLGLTQFVAPRALPQTVVRPRVHRLLDCARGRPLTVVCAPPGYGKTTALADWCRQRDVAHVWISLDGRDDDPQRLCARLVAAVELLSPSARWAAGQALVDGADPVETVIPLVADAFADVELVVVLDDYHAITAAACHRLLSALIDSLPDRVRIVVASRTRPPLRLARRDAARSLTEIDAAALAFEDDEARQLLNRSLRLPLGAEQAARINERVEGWPAGLSLIASSLRNDRHRHGTASAIARADDRIADYLTEEVLDPLPAPLRDFLCRTSVLPRLNGALCVAVLDDPRAGELLAQARAANLFVVALDDDVHGWVRYHARFAKTLRRGLAQRDPTSVPGLHQRASRWFEQHGMPEEAIEHATSASDGPRAARLLHDHWWQMIVNRRYEQVRDSIARLPLERGPFGPFCVALDALCMSLEGADPRLTAQRCDALECHRDAPGVAILLDTMRFSPYHGDVGRAVVDGWRIWSEAADDPRMRARQAGKFATVLWFAGDREAFDREVVPYLGLTDRPTLRSWELAALALTAADADDLDAAEYHAREAVAVIEAAGGQSALESHLAYLALAEALRRLGRLDEAHERLASSLRTTRRLPGSVYHAFALVIQAQLDLSSRDRAAARAHAAAARRIVNQYPDVGRLAARLAAVEVTLAENSQQARPEGEPTPAERRVLELLQSDRTRREIGAELGLSPATVKSHMWRLYRRLGATNREEAIAIARRRGML